MGVKIGVLALQGNVSEHIRAFRLALADMNADSGSSVFALKTVDEIAGCDALAIPGGESTTISRLIDKNGMRDPITGFDGGIFATCAGMVLMASEVDDPRLKPLGMMDMAVDRNAFGRQRESFEADIEIEGLDSPFHAVFIRAPVVSEAGPGVRVIGSVEQGAVAVVSGKHMALSFHPELGADTRLHRLFIENLGP